MTTLLHVSASPRGAASESLALASAFLDTYREVNPDVMVETLDLWQARCRCSARSAPAPR